MSTATAGAPPCQIELEFGEGVFLFRLNLPQIAELETLSDAGIGEIFRRVLGGRYSRSSGVAFGAPTEAAYTVQDIYEAVRLGLIGGGDGELAGEPVKVGPTTARRLVETYAAVLPMAKLWDTAAAVLVACCRSYAAPESGPRADKKGAAEDGRFDYASALNSCRAMGVDPERLSLWEFTALVAGWNAEVRAQSGEPPASPPTAERVERNLAKIPAAAFGQPIQPPGGP